METNNYIFINLDIQFYYLQQQLSILISQQLNNITPLTFIIVFLAGILTSLNPCLLSVLPISVSYIYGRNNSNRFINKIIFLAGITSSLIYMVFSTSILSQPYYNLVNKIPILSSILIIFIGLSLLQILNVSDFLPSLNSVYSFSSIQSFQDYSVGLVLGLSSTPCSAPILLIILVWLSNSQYWILGYFYIFIYCIGYILPLIVLVNYFLNYNQISNIIKSWNYIIPISGSCVLGLGVFSFLEKLFI